ncbi:MAG: SCO family protein [Acidobacteriota bacterium]|nr:SCO family protein [Acidobacteriota bacterium]
MRRLFVSVLLLAGVVVGCHSNSSNPTQTASDSKETVYHLRGKIIGTQPGTGEVYIDNDDIPGFMEKMVMPYKLKDPSILSDLHPGDVLTAQLHVPKDGKGGYYIDQIVIVAQAKPDYKPKISYHVPSPGDHVPDFHLRNQNDKVIHLDQYKGKALLITFIYTRCPLPNFCPLVTRNFANIEKQLEATPGLLKKTQLLCVSFDPDHDTPARLRAYGAQYLGSDASSTFAHINFAVPDKKVLSEMAKYFDVGITVGPNDQITHTLSTTLIGPDGKVVQFYPGNEWTVEQVMGDLKHSVPAV